jgi:hypothetical protein
MQQNTIRASIHAAPSLISVAGRARNGGREVPLPHSATKTSAAHTDMRSAIGQTQPAAAVMDISSIKDVSGGKIEQDFAKVAPDETKAAVAGTIKKSNSGSKIGQNQSAAVQMPSTLPRTRKTAATPGKHAAESPMTASTVFVEDDSDDDSFNISEQVRCKPVFMSRCRP